MIDVSGKALTDRRAKASAFIKINKAIIKRIRNKKIQKGDVLEQARVAGIMAAKKTPDIIPLCHPLRLNSVTVSFRILSDGINVVSEVRAFERTGVEMEALTACSAACLTIYDMCKMYDKGMEIRKIALLEKSGGKSGRWQR